MAKRIGANRRKSLAEKKKKVRKKIRFSLKRVCISSALILGLLGVAVGMVMGGRQIGQIVRKQNFLRIEAIEVHGIERVDTATVIALSGITKGKSLLRIEKKQIINNMKKIPWVSEARVKRCFPATVVITIREREPIALIAIDNVYLTDEHGVLIDLPKQQYFNLPVFTGLRDSVVPGGNRVLIDSDKQRLSSFLTQVQKTQPEIAKRLAHASFDNNDNVRIGLEASSVTIALQTSRISTGIAHLWQVLQSIHAENAQTPKSIDLRYSNMAYVQ